jgi:hypothetical protein
VNNPTAAVQNTNILLDLNLKNTGRFMGLLLLLLLILFSAAVVHDSSAGLMIDLALIDTLFVNENGILI